MIVNEATKKGLTMAELSDTSKSILELIRTGQATTRTDIVNILALAPSTVSMAVRKLIRMGFLDEIGANMDTGGRPSMVLSIARQRRTLAVAEFGREHVRLGLATENGVLTHTQSFTLTADPNLPEAMLKEVVDLLQKMAADQHWGISAFGFAMPAPVDPHMSRVIQAANLPTWNNFPIIETVRRFVNAPVVVDNDARAGALGELHYRRTLDPTIPAKQDVIYIKAGTSIGGAFLHDGQMIYGKRGFAGDIAHVKMDDVDQLPCRCGNTGCLDTKASAAAIREALAQKGLELTTNRDLLDAAGSSPTVAKTLRDAAEMLGDALAPVVTFLTPDALWIGGTLSALDSTISGISASLYKRGHPSTIHDLRIEKSLSGRDAALWGLAHRCSLLTGGNNG